MLIMILKFRNIYMTAYLHKKHRVHEVIIFN